MQAPASDQQVVIVEGVDLVEVVQHLHLKTVTEGSNPGVLH
jgi:hypothetical protein